MTTTPAETPPAPVNVSEPRSDDDFEPDPVQNPDQGKPDSDDALGDAGKKALDRMKADRAEAVKRAKTLERELADLKKKSMSDDERALSEAEARGRQAATAEFGTKFARASFDALAAKKNADIDTDSIVEFVDMRKFLTDDGDVDTKALQAAVDRLVPAPAPTDPSFDGGARGGGPAPATMNDIIRQQAGLRRNS